MRVFLAAFLLALAACAPQNTAPPAAQTRPLFEGKVGFYPAEPGLEWVYLPQSSTPVDPAYRLAVTGSGSFAGQAATRYRFTGRGQERVFYRQVGAGGVRLLGFEEVITNGTVRFNPPMQEYPAEGALAVGASWGGLSRVESTLTAGGQTTRLADSSFEYAYTVVGKSVVNVGAGGFEVFRIRLEIRPSQGERESYEIWFTPGVGELRTREGLQLQERNFK